MILTCPNCGTQYAVKDDAIPSEGRQVRCAACKHSWHQEPENEKAEVSEGSPVARKEDPAPAAQAERAEDEETVTETTLIEPRSGPEAEERAYDEAVIERNADVHPAANPLAEEAASRTAGVEDERPVGAPAAADWREPPMANAENDAFAPFPADLEEQPRRSAAKPILLVLLLLIVAAALFWFLAPPDLKAKLGIAEASATLLQVQVTHQDRTKLESGNELLTVTGRVINPSATQQEVPPIQAELKNRSGKVVYSWRIQPDTTQLAGGASTSFNSAEVNVPPGADQLAITLGEQRT